MSRPLISVLTPHGSLRLDEAEDEFSLEDGLAERLEKCFTRVSGHGLLQLGAGEAETNLPLSLAWWRDFALQAVHLSRASPRANGNRSARRMRSSDCTKSSSGGSRPRPCCLPRKLPRCCSGPCWLLARSRCARWTVGKASPRSLPIKSLTLPHDQIS